MRKGEKGDRWDEQKMRWFLLDSAEEEPVPDSLQPKQMEEWLRRQTEGKEPHTEENEKHSHGRYFGWWCGALATAACLALVIFAVGRNTEWKFSLPGGTGNDMAMDDAADDMAAFDDAAADDAAADDAADDMVIADVQEGTTYAKLYQSFDKYWSEEEELYREVAYDTAVDVAATDDVAEEDVAADDTMDDAAADDAAMDTAESASSMDGSKEVHFDKGGSEETGSSEELADGVEGEVEHGKTNQQEESVEEADIIKNDGRYLYRVFYGNTGNAHSYRDQYAVRIIDTKGGLKELSLVGDFESIENIYVWKDKLVVIEPGWAEQENGTESGDDPWRGGYHYCKIHVYDISDRAKPQEYHTFTIKGSYKESRISDGYLYFFTSCSTRRPEREEELRAYVPMLDDKPMDADKIALPEGNEAASYLVMASVDMEHPDKITDSHALVTAADRFYVSQDNIYMADTRYLSYNKTGRQTDSTVIYRYSYKDGMMKKEAQGTVKGTLRDDMAMNEYQNHLRLVTTVESYGVTEVIDDITGELIGYDDVDASMTNSLYVLNDNLETVGMVEDLAPGERLYSARFMGNIGYFVTFRETDPLFSVDLSVPEDPKILGELKISGFSEYLHFYADNLLLGIGMEADEGTGETQCLKLSMFDISNPADVKEKSKLKLEEYDDADALYNYKAVLIDTKKNLFGFYAYNYEEYDKQMYLLFKFEDGEFKKIMEIPCSDSHSYGYDIRGTYIGDRFFLTGSGRLVEEYSLLDGSKTGELK